MLTLRIEQRLKEQQFQGLGQSYYIHTSGIRYPILMVDAILDMGQYFQFGIVFCGKYYANYLEAKAYAKYEYKQAVSSHPRDKDF